MSRHPSKRVLIVAYYWPPSGGGGVQRWLKMVRYLAQCDIEPVVVCPSNADYPVLDPTLQEDVPEGLEVIRIPVFEPYRLVRQLTGRKSKGISAGFVSEGKKGPLVRLLGWARGNFLIPDARKFWVRPAVRKLKAYLLANPADVIITTGPPHSVHLIGLGLHEKTGIPWIVDMRDFWMDMDHADLFSMGNRAKSAHAALEKKVIATADRVVCTTPGMAAHYSLWSRVPAAVITNGFDAPDFAQRPKRETDFFVVGHYGTLSADRFTPALWEALELLSAEQPDFSKKLRIELMGPTDGSTLRLIESGPLGPCLRYKPYVPHPEAVDSMCRAGLLVLVVNENTSEKSRLPGKIFEYIASETPVLGIGNPDSDAGRLVTESGRGRMCERSDKEGMRAFIESVFLKTWLPEEKPLFSSRFTREHLARDYSEIIHSLGK